MKLHLYSDIHLDHYVDWGQSFKNDIKDRTADVCVVAGDITTSRFPNSLKELATQLSRQYTDTILVRGNHDHYKCSLAQVEQTYKVALDGLSNVHLLNNRYVEIQGKTFYGGTMWFRDSPESNIWKFMMPDFRAIPNLEPWVYDQNTEFEHMLRSRLMPGEIVISHHLPAEQCISPGYKKHPLNCFFLCDQTELILDRKPAAWLFGHTHMSYDKMLGDTRLVCNPRGYPKERLNKYKPKEIEL